MAVNANAHATFTAEHLWREDSDPMRSRCSVCMRGTGCVRAAQGGGGGVRCPHLLCDGGHEGGVWVSDGGKGESKRPEGLRFEEGQAELGLGGDSGEEGAGVVRQRGEGPEGERGGG